MPQVALITGAARRVGAAIARRLHQEGMRVALHYHTSKDAATSLCQELNEIRPHSAMLLQADLTATTQLEKLIEQVLTEWGKLHVLINNASRFYRTPLDKATEIEWNDLLDSNLKAPFFLAQAASPYLAMQQGCIINIADIHGERPMRDYGVYCISKAGLIMLTKVLAKELSPDIRVNAIAPGTVMAPEGENNLTPELKQKILDRIALHKMGEAEDVAKAVMFLIRDANYITGQVLTVDGGRSLLI